MITKFGMNIVLEILHTFNGSGLTSLTDTVASQLTLIFDTKN